jgi:SAM-dependent methyltransferase
MILEAGCGREWFVPLKNVDYEITGIDLDAEALRSRVERRKDLHHAIHGDLRTVSIPDGAYHVIYSSYVLEHVRGAEALLEKFSRWVTPGGIIVVRVPDRDSVHGLLTRMTPFLVHVLYYRWVEGLREAGQPGFAPYPTYYDTVVSREGIARFCERHGLTLEAISLHGDYARGGGFFRVAIPLLARVVSWLSLGRYSAESSNITFVIRKPLENSPA